MTIRRRSGLVFLAACLSFLCLYVFFHGNNVPSIQRIGNGQAYGIDLSYLDQKQRARPDASEASLTSKLPAGHPFVKHNPEASTPPSERPLITYVYYETDFARINLQFFLNHALHDAADFIFILNGETDAERLIFADPYADVPKNIRHLFPHPTLSNVFVKKRPNTCFDLGAHAEVLQSALGDGTGWLGVNGPIHGPQHKDKNGVAQLLRHHYTRFILLNGSIRGPFLPAWSRGCWSDIYLNRLTQRIKLVGMSYNCHFGNGHVQSMIWATDRIGLDLMLTKEGMGECFTEIGRAMDAEVRMTKVFRDHDFEVDAFLSNYHSKDKEARYARMRARMQAGQNLAKREEVEAAVAPTAATGGILMPPTEEISGDGDIKVKADYRALLDRSRTVPEWQREEMWAAMRAEIMAGHGKAKREADQMGDVVAKPAPTDAPPKDEYEITPTKEEEEEMIKTYHLRENPVSEQWYPNPVERYPLFPKSKRDQPPAEAVETRSPPIEDETHHPYADISAQHQNYSQKLITDSLDEPGYFWRECHDEDWLGRGSYADSFVHPFENLFMKSHRGIADTLLGNLTMWADGAGTNSWDVCR